MKLNAAREYEPMEHSIAFPNLSMDVLSDCLRIGIEKDEAAALDALDEWLAG